MAAVSAEPDAYALLERMQRVMALSPREEPQPPRCEALWFVDLLLRVAERAGRAAQRRGAQPVLHVAAPVLQGLAPALRALAVAHDPRPAETPPPPVRDVDADALVAGLVDWRGEPTDPVALRRLLARVGAHPFGRYVDALAAVADTCEPPFDAIGTDLARAAPRLRRLAVLAAAVVDRAAKQEGVQRGALLSALTQRARPPGGKFRPQGGRRKTIARY